MMKVHTAAGETAVWQPEITLQQIKTGFTGDFCYVHARGAIMPDGTAIVTTQPLFLKGDDDFYGLEFMESSDGGKSWSSIRKSRTLARSAYKEDCEWVISDAAPFYHRKSGKLIITGHSSLYHKDGVSPTMLPRHTLWSIFDHSRNDWEEFRELAMPEEKFFFNCGAGSTQIVELPDGDLMIPVYTADPEDFAGTSCYHSLVVRCSFDGTRLSVREIGTPVTIPVPRGLYEPSIAAFKGKFFLALRNDESGYVCKSDDGLNYHSLCPLCFDDGRNVGNYCTQQHWVTGGGKLYLVYTRKGAGNDHVFRHRAPLFMAELDTERLCLIRKTEMIVVPERGARLGNFGCMQVNENEAWVIAAEWMQTTAPDPFDYTRCMKYGSDNSIWISKIKFPAEKANQR
ncbi:MAG: exo-alpha-sialidase [Lentisphaerae bacterium]|nr:exo-alpha-sialidase [Lentisphaerota bacterium]